MRFGQYELQGRIAVGGMAEVYRGRAVGEEGFEKPVAIKRILPQLVRDGRFVSMLVTEARIHAQLSHRNIVQIQDLGVSEEGEYFIVLEYVDGPDLATLLEGLAKAAGPGGARLRLADSVALHIAIELGEGLHFAHELRGADGQPLGLVHRDISPSNVLISYAGEVKLADFGLAKRRTDDSVVGSLKGKLAYMSPEQARRAPLDRRSDIFSLGAVLFEMLTGRRLRDIGDDLAGWQQVASGVMTSARSLRPDLPAVLDQLLLRSVAPAAQDRFEDARSFVIAARQALELVPRGRASETVELQELLKRVQPPGSPRRRVEQSKVIRLVADLVSGTDRVLGGEARARAENENDVVTTVSRGARPSSIVVDDFADAPTRVARPSSLGAAALNPVSPPPLSPSPSPPPRSATPVSMRGATPSAPLPLTRTRRTPGAGATPPQSPGPVGPPKLPTPPMPAARAQTPTATPPARTQPSPAPHPVGGSAAALATAQAPSTWNRVAATPATWPAPPDAPPRRTGTFAAPVVADAPVYADPAPSAQDGPLWSAPGPAARKSSRVATVVALGLLAVAAAVGLVHTAVVPLDVLVVWGKPVRVEVVSQPPGAEVLLDGERLPSQTPLLVEISRDRQEHALEVRKPGWKSARQILRLDRSREPRQAFAFPLEPDEDDERRPRETTARRRDRRPR